MIPLVLIAVVLLPATSRPAAAGMTVEDLCPGSGTCVIDGEQTIESYTVLDLEDRDVLLNGTLHLVSGILLRARDVTVRGSILGDATVEEDAASVEIYARNVNLEPGSRFSLRGILNERFPGELILDARDSVAGELSADLGGWEDPTVEVTAGNDLSLVVQIDATWDGRVTLSGACALAIESPSGLTAGPEGEIEFYSAGSMRLSGAFSAGADGSIETFQRPDQPLDISGATFVPNLGIETDDQIPPCDPPVDPTLTPTEEATPTSTTAVAPTLTSTPEPTPTWTATASPTAEATPTRTAPACVGDCDSSPGAPPEVTVDEILTMVNVALGNADVDACPTGDANGDGEITVDEILQAVGHALNGCPIEALRFPG